MENIKIVTDSTTSLSKEKYEELGIICLETTYMVDGEEHHAFDDPETTEIDFYAKLEKSKKVSTGCVNINTFEECFEGLVNEGYKVVYVGLSASLSSTFSNSQIAMNNINEKFGEKKVAVVDSRCASFGTLILIERIQELVAQEKSLEEIEETVSNDAKSMSVAFVSPDLSFMFRSGRLNILEAGLGKLLKIVPIIFVSETGKLKAKEKCIGLKLTLKKLKSDFVNLINTKNHKKVYLTSCNMPNEIEDLKMYIDQNTSVKAETIKTGLIDKTLSCCCGPRTVAIFCL